MVYKYLRRVASLTSARSPSIDSSPVGMICSLGNLNPVNIEFFPGLSSKQKANGAIWFPKTQSTDAPDAG